MEKTLKDQSIVASRLQKTTNRIKKARKNVRNEQKEAAEFQEIHKLLNEIEHEELSGSSPPPFKGTCYNEEFSIIPYFVPEAKSFNEDLAFSLFNEESLSLRHFIKQPEECIFFNDVTLISNENTFRNFVANHAIDVLMPENEEFSAVSLYVLYLMSVHEDPVFVSACFDYLNSRPFCISVLHVLPIFFNFGFDDHALFATIEDDSLVKKFCQSCRVSLTVSKKQKFPYHNLEKIGKILLIFVTRNLFTFTPNVKTLVIILRKVLSDLKVRTSSLAPIYSALLTAICLGVSDRHETSEIADWLHLEQDHLLRQIEFCRTVSKSIYPDLHDFLILKTISEILKSDDLPVEPPLKITHAKHVLRDLKKKKVSPLEFYGLLQLLSSSLPGVTATQQDSVEISDLLGSLERSLSETKDYVDLIRLKLEMAKIRSLVASRTSSGSTVKDSSDDRSAQINF